VTRGEDQRTGRGVDARSGERPGKRQEDEEDSEASQQPGSETGSCHRDVCIVVEGRDTVKKEAGRPAMGTPLRAPAVGATRRYAYLDAILLLATFLLAAFFGVAPSRSRCFSTAWAAARRAIGSRYGEQET
jgi:hypothetical protein